jgi:hypothetical protein
VFLNSFGKKMHDAESHPALLARVRRANAMYSMMPHYAHLPPNFVVPVALEKNLCPTGTTALVRC